MSLENRRRTLAELEILYRTHPRLRDVLVEGSTDAQFYSWFLRESGVGADVQVYDIDARAEVPKEAVLKVHPEINRRGRLYAVSAAAQSWGEAGAGVTCIVDSDFNVLEGGTQIPSLLETDYPALEVYALQRRPLAKFLDQVIGGSISADELIETLLPLWFNLFVLRLVLLRESGGHALLEDFAKRCFDKRGTPTFDAEKVIKDSTQASKQEVERLFSAFVARAASGPEPSLATIRGHDVAPVLIHHLRLKNELAQVSTLERLLRACIELADLVGQPLFQRLIARVTS